MRWITKLRTEYVNGNAYILLISSNVIAQIYFIRADNKFCLTKSIWAMALDDIDGSTFLTRQNVDKRNEE